jgi:outer membrane protein assembly factor BamD
MIGVLSKDAASAYSQIITRYPVMDRGEDAKKRLAVLHQPIPRPTKAAVAQNRAEDESRRENSTLERLMSVVKKGPDVATASKIGEPTLVDPTPVSASGESRDVMRQVMGLPVGDHSLAAEVVNGGPPAANDPAPRSDAPAAAAGDPFARPAAASAADPNELKPGAPDPGELKPSGPPDPNELKPVSASASAAANDVVAAPPVQVNEIQQGAVASADGAAASSSASSNLASDQDVSSSKKKKKKGLKKIISF